MTICPFILREKAEVGVRQNWMTTVGVSVEGDPECCDIKVFHLNPCVVVTKSYVAEYTVRQILIGQDNEPNLTRQNIMQENGMSCLGPINPSAQIWGLCAGLATDI